ncbi:hypothetical protein EON65_03935 [archaeon]|nr:MAG: hypothetical protein EON65_03935 [archaeon]
MVDWWAFGLVIICFLLAVFDHALWTLAQTQPNIPTSEYNALYSLYNGTNGANWTWKDNIPGEPWDFSQDDPNPCFENWEGIDCSCTTASCHVVKLTLTAHNLTGSLDATIGNLTELVELALVDNQLVGTLPSELGRCKNISFLDLRQNLFTGTIPNSLGEIIQLSSLNLSMNNLRGPIPPSIFTLPNITVVAALGNRLHGELPEEFYASRTIRILEVNNNNFNGTISDKIGEMSQLLSFRINDNLISGTLPKAIGNLTNLARLFVGINFIEGTIPPELGNLTNIEELILGGNLFYGSFPSSISNLRKLSSLDISRNLLDKSLPSNFGTNINLEILYTYYNLITGSLPDCSQMSKMRVFDVSYNHHSGSTHEQLPALAFQQMNYFQLSENYFTGYLSDFYFPMLFLIAVHNNMLTGPIPSEIANSLTLNFCDYGANAFSGTIPPNYGAIMSLTYFAVNDNCLTGPVPDLFAMDMLLAQLFLAKNYLTGTLPSSLGDLPILIEMDALQNKFHGTVPSSWHKLSKLQILFLSTNQLTGPLSNIVNTTLQQELTNIDLSHNSFTGTIPEDIFLIPTLKSYAAAANCLHGKIPETVCQATSMTSLVLDGVSTAPSCRVEIFPFISFMNAFVLMKVLDGTIPSCIFSLPRMQSIHLSANQLTGTLPDNVDYSPFLQDLSIAHNYVSGSIPYVVQTKNFSELDLSYNRFGGHLSDDFYEVPEDGAVYLEVNRLSGNIPKSLKRADKIELLNGNIFQCDADRSSLPDKDPDASIYVCGSDSIDRAMLAWCICIATPIFAIICYIIYSRVLKKNDQAVRYAGYFMKKWFSLASRLRASNVILVMTKADGTERHVKMDNGAISELMKFFDLITRTYMVVTLYILFILMPIYLTFSKNSNTFESEYGWQVSAVLLKGQYAASTMTITFCLLLTLLVSYFVYTKERTIDEPTQMRAKAAWRRSKPQQEVQIQKPLKKRIWDNFALGLITFINLSMMVTVDCGYVYIVLNYNRDVVITTQFFLAIFKIFWNEVALWILIPYFKKMLLSADERYSGVELRRMNTDRSLAAVTGDMPTDSQNLFSDYDHEDVKLLTMNILINNIIVPAAAIACVSSNCFNNALIKASTVTESYLIILCGVYTVNYEKGFSTCIEQRLSRQNVNYDPQFMYSYQCASTVSINYFTVFIYMFMISGLILPLLKLWIRHYYKFIPNTTRVYEVLIKVLPQVLKAVSAETEALSFRLFQREKFTLRMISHLATIMAFGAIYPPLAFIGFASTLAVICTEQFLLGQVLFEADSRGYLWYRSQLIVDCDGISVLYFSCIWQIVPFCCLIVGYLVFDTCKLLVS